MHGLLTVELIEDEETIRLIIHRRDREPETLFLDADDTSWELTFHDDLSVCELRTSTNGDFR